jgi:hypothetical protein
MNWKQPITTECLKLDTTTRLVFMEIMIHCRNEDMEYPAYFIHGNQSVQYKLKRGQAIFQASIFYKLGIHRRLVEASIETLSTPNCTFTCTFTRKPFGFIVSVLNYDELIKFDDFVHSQYIHNTFTVHSPVHTNHKSVKSGETDKTVKIDKQDDRILEILNFFNQTFKKTNKSSVSWEDNAKYWLEIYTLDEIKQAMVNLDHPLWFAREKPPNLELMFRKSNKNGRCDYIQSLLDLPAKNKYQPNETIQKIPTPEELMS